ncbi:protein NRT1/ PTR FAMILY 8.1-like [Rutidosis leptorrhynchoides]|uniref:protein NRT1/ PTR FAMILY 8.1-like n=1 Tax=Rutidosis leptorrhynchoides TaxID=125765 RepID=UPI003A99D5B7
MPEIVFRNIPINVQEDTYTKDGTIDYQNNPADKRITGTWKACPYILGNECCERFAFYGVIRNLSPYFETRLDQHHATASKTVLNWSRTCYLTPLIGAFFADAYIGRYWIIFIFSIIYVLGMSLLTISASVPGLKPSCKSKGNCKATSADIEIAYVALYLVALATGGIKSCVSTYGADQFDEADEVENKRKSSFFNWFYFASSIGALLTTSIQAVIQDRGWGWKFGLPAVAMSIAVGSFYSGTHLYRYQKPSGSPFTRIFQVIVASWRKRGVHLPIDKSNLYETRDAKSTIVGSRKIEHTKDFSFLDKAAVELQSDQFKTSIDPWRLCTVTQVEEFKSIIKLLPIWATTIIFSTVYRQMSDLFILQGSKMDLTVIKFKIQQPETIRIFDILSVLFWIPVYDRVIVPYTRKYTGHKAGITQLQRIGIGLLISIYAILSAGVLEIFRLRIIRRNNYYDLKNIPMSVFWQVPQYFLIGCAEVFTFIGHIEFFYDQAPDSMRSLCSALSLSTVSFGSYLSSLLVTIVRRITTKGGKPGWIPDDDNLNHVSLQNFFWLLSLLSLINLGAYLLVARWYTYKRAVGAHLTGGFNLRA